MHRTIVALWVALLALPLAAWAEVKEVQIARGFAIPHLPIMVMEHEKLLEKHASSTTFPPRKGWSLSTPVSSTAMTVPVPSKDKPAEPPGHTWSAWTKGTLSARNGR